VTQLDDNPPAAPRPAAPHPRGAGLAGRLRTEVARRLAEQAAAAPDAGPLTGAARTALGRRLISEALDGEAAAALAAGQQPLDPGAEQRIGQMVFDELFAMGGFQPLLNDPDVESINANGCDQVYVQYSGGRRARVAPVAASDAELTDLIRAIATRAGTEERRFDRATPRVSVPLPGGGRLFAVMAVTGRPCVAIRRDRLASASLEDLVANGTLDEPLAAFLAAVVKARKNILVSGGTSAGKTTMLRALASAIPPRERLITIEDSLELCLDWDHRAHPDVVAMQSREANVEGEGEITLAELVRWALRMTPDRVIVGEVRGSEVIPMLNAMSQGNDGSMTTIHASSSRGAFMKLAAYAAQAGEHLSMEETNLLVAGAVHLVIQLAWDTRGHRCISSIREVTDADGRQIVSNEVYAPGPDRRAVPAVPVRAATLEELAATGWQPPGQTVMS
jgi:pilus assembly protein CpaF